MRRTSSWFVLFSLTVLAVPVRAETTAMPTNAILMGWDGAHRDHVKALLKDGKLPNLQKLIDEGTLVDVDVTSGATDTKAGWSQILTGYRPETTGVYSNGRFRDVPAGYSVFERLRAAYGADKIATVAVIGKKGHCGEIDPPFKRPFDPAKETPPAGKPGKKAAGKAAKPKQGPMTPQQVGSQKPVNRGRVVDENGAKFVVFEGSPYYTMHNNVDEWHFGLAQDAKVGDKALEMLDKYGKRPFFFFVHFAEVDHSGHRHGEPSREYDDAIVSGDQQLGRIVEKLKQLGVYEKTRIYVTADHGFDVGRSGHGQAPYVFLGTNDKAVMRAGTRADITPTILDRQGVDLSKIAPPLDGESLARAAVKPVEKAVGKPKAPGKAKGRQKRAKAAA
jgi:hypothetical protein